MGSSPNDRRPVRVLHLATVLYSGGVERWLVDLCAPGSAPGMEMDIAVIYPVDGLFARRARELGIRVFVCPFDGNPLKFLVGLWRLLRRNGPYDALHSHVHAFSGLALLAGRLAGVRSRVVHSHNVVTNRGVLRRGYVLLARALIRLFATAGFAPSAMSAENLFGKGWKRDSRWRVLPYGIDLDPFRTALPDCNFREALGIPADALVLASVGRLTAEKNSLFLVDVLAGVLRQVPQAYLVIVGEGPLREPMEQRAAALGCRERLLLPGTRPDVPALLRSVVDLFVFPSPPPPRGNEALPLAVIEAQAAGLPCLISDGLPPEAVLVSELILQLPEGAGAAAWAEAAVQRLRRREPDSGDWAVARLEQSYFNRVWSLRTLADAYRAGCA